MEMNDKEGGIKQTAVVQNDDDLVTNGREVVDTCNHGSGDRRQKKNPEIRTSTESSDR